MENANWIIVLCICGSLFFAIIGLTLISKVTSPVVNDFYSKLNIEKEERDIRNLSILDNGGALAPAVVLSARRVRSWGGSASKHSKDTNHLIDFEVEVSPKGEAPFRTKFREEIMPNGWRIVDHEMVSEHGKKIWVTYDPKDTSRAYLDHYDEDHEAEMKDHGMNLRRSVFYRSIERNEDLNKNGELAEASISRMDDVNLMFPMVKSRGIHFYLDVKPKTGLIYQAEANAIIPEASLQKYSVGKTIHVRLDPLKPERILIDNK